MIISNNHTHTQYNIRNKTFFIPLKFGFRLKNLSTGPALRVRFFRHHFANKLRAGRQRAQFSLISPKVVKTFYNDAKGSTRALSSTQLFLYNPRRPKNNSPLNSVTQKVKSFTGKFQRAFSLYFPKHRLQNR